MLPDENKTPEQQAIDEIVLVSQSIEKKRTNLASAELFYIQAKEEYEDALLSLQEWTQKLNAIRRAQ